MTEDNGDPPLPDVFDGDIEDGVLLDMLGEPYSPRRSGADPGHVEALARLNPGRLPPVLVQRSSMRVIDGAHRCAAARKRGIDRIRVRYVDCSDQDAFVLAVRLNALRGLPLAPEDRAAAVQRVLAWHPDWSDRAIAHLTGISAKTVATVRSRSGEESPHLNERLGRDGKRYRAARGSEGRKRAADYLTTRPDASVREVARAAGISLGTAHDVRARVRLGEDPVASGRPAVDPNRTDAHHYDAVAAVISKLQGDPSLRYTERGREFIRWISVRAVHGDEWRKLVEHIPRHWHADLLLVAEAASSEWRDLADHLRAPKG